MKAHKLIWVVQTGSVSNGHFEKASSDQYEITPTEAEMAFSKERRGFSHQEAVALQRLLDTLSLYCAESVVWWEHGEGVKLDENGAPAGHEKTDHEQKEQPTPKRKAPTSGDIALLLHGFSKSQ